MEPEPGCVLDTVADAVGWLAPRVDPEFVGLCLDTCHLAVSFADPAKTVAAIHEAGLRVVKVQASAAVHVPDPADPVARARIAEFVEPRYLHQVRELTGSGDVLAADDLDEALDSLPARGPWRVHFHVPLHAEPEGPLQSTAHVIREVLAALPPGPAIEVETYTRGVLPPQLRQDLVSGNRTGGVTEGVRPMLTRPSRHAAAVSEQPWRVSSVPVQVSALAGRALHAMADDRRALVLGRLQPLMTLFVFGEILGGLTRMSDRPGIDYIDFLVPAILLNSGLAGAQFSATALVKDMRTGVLARFRSLPISLFSILLARSLADLARACVHLVVVPVFAVLLFGFSPPGGVAGVLGALVLSALITWTVIWVFLALACWLRSAEAMQSIGVIVMFPLMFASSAFVPLEALPGWLQAVAMVNPLTYGVQAGRSLVLAQAPSPAAILGTAASCLVLGGLAAWAARRWFQRPPGQS